MSQRATPPVSCERIPVPTCSTLSERSGLLYQVLRKMPVPYATICKPDHGIRVLKHQMMDVLSLLLIHTIPSFAKSHQKISCHAINSRQLIYLNWWLSPCSIIVLHTDRHNLTCSGAASFNMLANSTEMLTSGGTGMLLPSRV